MKRYCEKCGLKLHQGVCPRCVQDEEIDNDQGKKSLFKLSWMEVFQIIYILGVLALIVFTFANHMTALRNPKNPMQQMVVSLWQIQYVLLLIAALLLIKK
ncbi:hypothetical protein ACFL35_04330 [Candidatus Riflebacteria bacterium]